MRDVLLPAALLGVSLGLGAGSSRGSGARICACAVAGLLMAFFWRTHAAAAGNAFVTAWAAIALCAGATWLEGPTWIGCKLVLACATGVGAGLLVRTPLDGAALLFAGALVLATAAGRLLSAKGWTIALRVAASWLLAIAVLNATLTVLPVTPGYLPDHLE